MPSDPAAYVSAETFYYLLPELLLGLAAIALYVLGAFLPGGTSWSWSAAGAVIVAAAALWVTGDTTLTTGPVATDTLALWVRWLVLLLGFLLVLMGARTAARGQPAEYYGSLLLVVTGLMLTGTAHDLALIFVGLELISIPTYILLYLGRRDAHSQEATTKYFLLSVMTSALMLYGFSFVYGVGGSTRLPEVAATLAAAGGETEGLARLAPLAVVLLFAGLGFKIAAVPFHFYAPDVYQGTTPGNAGLLAIAPKVAGFIILLRIVVWALPGQEPLAGRLALILAALTMTVGNVVALWQDHVRRLLAYSSIAHAGYMLIGLAVGLATVEAAPEAMRFDGLSALLFYLAVYAVATCGTFAALTFLGRGDQSIEAVDDLAGVGRTHPFTGGAMAVFMFSLAGIPPLAGFWGKLTLFAGAMSVPGAAGEAGLGGWFVGLAVLGVINAAIAAFYYLRIISVMYFRAPRSIPRAEGGVGAWGAAMVAALLLLVVGLWPAPLLDGTTRAVESARQRSSSLVAGAPAADVPAADVPVDDALAADQWPPLRRAYRDRIR